jgi:FkbM family methyltransferase
MIRRIHGETVSVRYADDRFWIIDWPTASVPMAEPWHSPTPMDEEALAYDLFFQEYTPAEGDIVIDVGAGIGTELVLFSRLVGPEGHVYAIEADPETFGWLERRRDANGLTNVTLVEAAASDAPGELLLSTEGAHYAHHVATTGTGLPVKAITLDGLVEDHRLTHVDFLKMNIEGAERMALEGMRDSIGLVRNAAIACHDFLADTGGDDWMRTKDFVHRFLQRHGFDVVERRADDDRPWARDYVFARRPRSG